MAGIRARQTNPISPARDGGWRYEYAKQSQFAGRCRRHLYKQSQTWAGWGIWGAGQAGSVGGGVLYKQTQFLALRRSGDRRSGEGNRAKQTQLPPGKVGRGRPTYEEPTMRNKANPASRPTAWGQLYKQSQFPPRRQDGQRLVQKGVMVNSTFDRLRQNKANSGGAADRAKQTQFFDCGPGSKSGVTTWRIGHRPVTGHALRAGGQLYKQSQFQKGSQVSSVKLESPV